MKKLIIPLLAMLLSITSLSSVYASPGKLDAKRGHKCASNCGKYGLNIGEYHFHDKNGKIIRTKPKQQPVQPIQAKQSKEQLNLQLYDAVEKNDLKRVNELLNKGADPNAMGKTGLSALHRAIIKDQIDIVKALLISKANPNIRETLFNETPLMFAAKTQNMMLLQLLIQSGADLNLKSKKSMTVLEMAKSWGREWGNGKVIDFLQYAIDAKNSNTKPNTMQTKAKGNLKGAITWQYNDFIGTKPDVGAHVFLIPIVFDKNSISEKDASSFAVGYIPPGVNAYHTTVNGFGYYELINIPAGKYYVVVSSNKTTRNFEEPIDRYTISVLQPLVRDLDTFIEMRLKLNKYEVREIEILPDKTTDFSYDFGNTYS